MDGSVFLLLGTAFAISEGAMGAYISRHAAALAGRASKPVAPFRLLGRSQIAMAIVILLLVLAISFGVIGPFGQIKPISL